MNIGKLVIGACLVIVSCILVIPSAFCKDTALEKKLSEIEQEMITNGNYKEAASKLEIITQTYPDNAAANMDLGLAYYGLMDYEKAYEYFNKADESGMERDEKKLLLYARSNIENNKSLLNSMGSETDKMNLAAKHYTMLGEILKERYFYLALAIAHIIWLKENVPDFPGLYELSAGVYYSAMQYKKAIEDYKKAIEENPDNIGLYKTLADAYVATGDYDNARGYYDKTTTLYKKQGLKDSFKEILEIKNIKQALPRRYKDISDLVKAERYFEAEEICKKRISLNAGDVAAITQLGQIYWTQERRAPAIKMFRRAVKIAPDYPVAHFFLGKAYFFERKPEKGKDEFKIFEDKMRILPKMDEETIDFYTAALHEIVGLNIAFGDYKEAKLRIEKIIKLKPDDTKAHYNLAVCYYNYFHNRMRAYEELQKVIELDAPSRLADRAKVFIDYIRRNPDARIIEDFSFINED